MLPVSIPPKKHDSSSVFRYSNWRAVTSKSWIIVSIVNNKYIKIKNCMDPKKY